MSDTAAIENVIQKLNKDLKTAAQRLSPNEARYLVDAYYTVQDYRKTTANQVRELTKSAEPNDLISWLFKQHEALEGQIKRALDVWSDSKPIGRWAKSIVGIGPVISAGLMAHIDITEHKTGAPLNTVSPVWRFAGLDPSVIWEKSHKRPWNGDLKTLCWKIGESFMKVSTNEKDFYGKFYAKRRLLEWSRNLEGLFASQARDILIKKNFDKKTTAYKWYSGTFDPVVVKTFIEQERSLTELPPAAAGRGLQMLPPDHILQRSKRYAVKLFLAHYHDTAYQLQFGKKPPNPYPVQYLGHDPAAIIPPPNQGVVL